LKYAIFDPNITTLFLQLSVIDVVFDNTSVPDSILRFSPRSDAKELEMRGNRAYLIGNFLKLHKKPPVGKQRGRFFRIFAASG
jgi:hypothetical protein